MQHVLTAQMLQSLAGPSCLFDRRSRISYETRMVRGEPIRGRHAREAMERLAMPLRRYLECMEGGMLMNPLCEVQGLLRLLRLLVEARRAVGQGAEAELLAEDLDETEALVHEVEKSFVVELPAELLVAPPGTEDESTMESVAARVAAVSMEEKESAEREGTDEEEVPECVICLSKLPDLEYGAGLKLACSHTYHWECLARWKGHCFMTRQPFVCGVCRRPAVVLGVDEDD